ncbi:MAG: c-type cytochrome [Thermodesulfovibrionales bacterium]
MKRSKGVERKGTTTQCKGFFSGGLKAVIVVAGLCISSFAWADGPRSGEDVYKEVCSACHGTGMAGAPKFGDKGVWAPLIAEGQHVVTAHAWGGVRGMPPRGGRPDLSLEEFARAAAYMARAAGGDWKDPDAAMLKLIRSEEKKRMEKMEHKK